MTDIEIDPHYLSDDQSDEVTRMVEAEAATRLSAGEVWRVLRGPGNPADLVLIEGVDGTHAIASPVTIGDEFADEKSWLVEVPYEAFGMGHPDPSTGLTFGDGPLVLAVHRGLTGPALASLMESRVINLAVPFDAPRGMPILNSSGRRAEERRRLAVLMGYLAPEPVDGEL